MAKKMFACDIPRREHITLLSRCSSLRIQVTRFDWELNSPNLNIFISIQSLNIALREYVIISIYFSSSSYVNARSLSGLSFKFGPNAKGISVDVRYLEGVGSGGLV